MVATMTASLVLGSLNKEHNCCSSMLALILSIEHQERCVHAFLQSTGSELKTRLNARGQGEGRSEKGGGGRGGERREEKERKGGERGKVLTLVELHQLEQSGCSDQQTTRHHPSVAPCFDRQCTRSACRPPAFKCSDSDVVTIERTSA